MNYSFENKIDSKQSHIINIISPFNLNDVGDDPRYSDTFVAVKTEIDKLTNADYAEVVRKCEFILSSESKDIRVAGYLLLAKTYVDGVDGLIKACEIYHALLERYGAQLHPQRVTARIQSYEWLNNDKLLIFFERYLSQNNVSVESLRTLKDLVNKVNKAAIEHIASDVSQWTILNDLIDRKIAFDTPTINKNIGNISNKSNNIIESKIISSEVGFTKSSSELIEYLIKIDDWCRAIAISRAIRWTGLVLPLNVDGCTKITTPRDSVLAQVKNAHENNDPKLLLNNCEQYFLEPGGHYWLDLQYLSVQLAKQLNLNDVSKLIEELTHNLVKKLPQLYKLKFSDGTPFANNKTRKWITEIVKLNEEDFVKQNEKRELSVISTRLKAIQEESLANGFEYTIEKLSEVNASTVSDRFYVDLTRLDVCLHFNQRDIAIHLADNLSKKVKKYNLNKWDPELAIQVWTRSRDLLSQLQKTVEIAKRIDKLEKIICKLDIRAAVNI